MKKIIFMLLMLVSFVACNKDSSDEIDDSVSNYIEVNGVRHKVDTFYLINSDFFVGSRKDGTYVYLEYSDSFYSFYDAALNKRIDLLDYSDEIKNFAFYDNNKHCKLGDIGEPCYYSIQEKGGNNYNVDLHINSASYKINVSYHGQAMKMDQK